MPVRSARLPVHLDLPRAVRARLNPAERYGLRLTLVAVAVLVVAIPFAYLTFQVLGAGSLTRLDGRLANTLNAWAHQRPNVVRGLEAISLLAKPITLWVVAGIAVAWLWRIGRSRIAIFVVVTSLGGGLVDTVVKVAVDRPRPVVDHPVATAFGKSFPSGHAMGATVVYGALLVAFWTLLPRRARRPALAATIVLVVAVCASRLLLGVHFLTDVVGGCLLGLAWLSGAVAAFEAWRHERVVEAVQAVTGEDGAMGTWDDEDEDEQGADEDGDGGEGDDVGRAPICPSCGVTALPAETSDVIDSGFVCENPDCDAFGEPIQA